MKGFERIYLIKGFLNRNSFLPFILLLFFFCIAEIYGKYTLPSHNSFSSLNRISGFVYDQNRNPIVNIFVELQDELNRSLSRVRTDSSGRYIFTGMSDGTFFVHVIPTGTDFQEQTLRVQVINIGPPGGNFGKSDDVTQDFYLRTRKRSSDKTQFQPGVVFAQEVPKKAQDIYKKAVSELNNDNYSEGIEYLEQTVEIFPTYFIALTRLGYAYFEQKKYAEASEYFARAADINPKSEPTIYLLAYSVFLTKRYDTAITILQGALGQKHTTSRIYLLFGKCFRIKKNYRDAEKALKLAESLNTAKDPEVHWELAKLYGKNLKEFGKAAAHLELFLKLQPDGVDKHKIKKLIQIFRNKEKMKRD